MSTEPPDDPRSLRFSLEDLVIPEPRAGAPYADAEDRHAADIAEQNGVPLTTGGLEAALRSGIDLLQSAAARLAGARAERALIPILREIANGNGDTARAAAAFALARLGEREEGTAALRACLDLLIEANLAPMQAAGSLARLGDPRGFGVLERALRSSNSLIRMVACKQLYFLAPLHGHELPDGRRVDAYALFDRALTDRDDDVAWQALAQLREVDTPEARARVQALAG